MLEMKFPKVSLSGAPKVFPSSYCLHALTRNIDPKCNNVNNLLPNRSKVCRAPFMPIIDELNKYGSIKWKRESLGPASTRVLTRCIDLKRLGICRSVCAIYKALLIKIWFWVQK